jgi:hypothetical protein
MTHQVRETKQARGRMAHCLFRFLAVALRRVAAGIKLLSQKKQLPQAMVNGTTTRSPTLNFFTSLPTSATMPIGSHSSDQCT